MGSNYRSKTGWVFHNSSSQAGNGNILSVGHGDVTMNVEVSGTSTDFEIVFEGKSHDNGNYHEIMVANLTSLELSTSATSNGLFQFGLEGLVKVRCRLSVISNGEVSVYGTVVN